MATDTTETRWYKVITFIFMLFVLIVLIYNLVILAKTKAGTVSSNEANTAYIINVILLVITVFIFVWSTIRLFIGRELRDQLSGQAVAYVTGEGTGIITPPIITTTSSTIIPTRVSPPIVAAAPIAIREPTGSTVVYSSQAPVLATPIRVGETGPVYRASASNVFGNVIDTPIVQVAPRIVQQQPIYTTTTPSAIELQSLPRVE